MREAVDVEEMIAILVDTARTATRDTDRIAAVRELLDRGFGKAPAFAAIEGLDPLELDEVSAEIAELGALLAARRAEMAPIAALPAPQDANGALMGAPQARNARSY